MRSSMGCSETSGAGGKSFRADDEPIFDFETALNHLVGALMPFFSFFPVGVETGLTVATDDFAARCL